MSPCLTRASAELVQFGDFVHHSAFALIHIDPSVKPKPSVGLLRTSTQEPSPFLGRGDRLEDLEWLQVTRGCPEARQIPLGYGHSSGQITGPSPALFPGPAALSPPPLSSGALDLQIPLTLMHLLLSPTPQMEMVSRSGLSVQSQGALQDKGPSPAQALPS